VGRVLVAAGIGLVVIGPVGAAVVGVITAIAVAFRRARWIVGLAAVAAVATTGVYVVQLQARKHLPPLLEWPTHFERVHLVALLAVVLLVARELVDRPLPDLPEHHQRS
jgi:hypothetical protein